jgi:D-glycero-D-manno-heptose 1,7-bisphosphate phosphatase
MLLNAANDYNISLADSYFIGDRIVDVQAGRAAGVRTILISEEGQLPRAPARDDPRSDWVFRELKEAVDFILEQP